MKGGTFGTWFKELATLVFTQTVQAFLLAVVMSIVISAMSGGSDGEGNATKATMAGGLLAIIALAQFNKLEMLVKSIFGIKSQFGDPMKVSPGGLTAGAIMAWRGGKRVLDNVGKVTGGLGGAALNQHKVNQLTKLKGNQKADAAELAADSAEAGLGQSTELMEDLGQDMLEGAKAGAAVNMVTNDGSQSVGSGGGTGGGNLGVSSSDITNLINALNNNAEALKSSKSGGAGALGSGTGSGSEKTESIDDRIEKAKAARNASLKKAGTGAFESVGSVLGGTVGLAGAAVSVGMGKDLGDAAQTVLTAAGVGDKMGEVAFNATASTTKTAVEIHNINSEIKDKNYQKNKKEKLEKKEEKKFTKDAKDRINSAQVRENKAIERKKVVDSINKQIVKDMPKSASTSRDLDSKTRANNYRNNKNLLTNAKIKGRANAGNID